VIPEGGGWNSKAGILDGERRRQLILLAVTSALVLILVPAAAYVPTFRWKILTRMSQAPA
jgi:hypothetical protein